MSSSESQKGPIMPPIVKIVVTALISCLMPTIGVLVMTVVLAKSKFDFGVSPDPKQVAAAIVADEHFPDLSQVTPEQMEWVDAVGVIIRGKPSQLERMLVSHPDLVKRMYDPLLGAKTLLHEASENDRVEFAKILLKHGADPLAKTGMWELSTPLHLAAKADSVDMINLLLEAGVDINTVGGGPPERSRIPNHQYPYDSPLDVAASAGSANAVALLLERGAKIDVNPPESSYSALHRAMEQWYAVPGFGKGQRVANPVVLSEFGNRKVVELLLEHGAILDSLDFRGSKPFHVAVYHRTVQSVQYLLDAHRPSVDVDEPGQYGFTPLQLAVCNFTINQSDQGKSIAIIELLLEAGADKSKRAGPSEPRTAFSLAQEEGWSEEVLELLRP